MLDSNSLLFIPLPLQSSIFAPSFLLRQLQWMTIVDAQQFKICRLSHKQRQPHTGGQSISKENSLIYDWLWREDLPTTDIRDGI